MIDARQHDDVTISNIDENLHSNPSCTHLQSLVLLLLVTHIVVVVVVVNIINFTPALFFVFSKSF